MNYIYQKEIGWGNINHLLISIDEWLENDPDYSDECLKELGEYVPVLIERIQKLARENKELKEKLKNPFNIDKDKLDETLKQFRLGQAKGIKSFRMGDPYPYYPPINQPYTLKPNSDHSVLPGTQFPTCEIRNEDSTFRTYM